MREAGQARGGKKTNKEQSADLFIHFAIEQLANHFGRVKRREGVFKGVSHDVVKLQRILLIL
jgi:hypothetical protein